MEGAGIILDGIGRIQETLNSALTSLTMEEVHREPHPPVAWLAWRLTHTQDSQISRLAGCQWKMGSDSFLLT